MENSRQNTRFRWRDAKKMEGFIDKVELTADGFEINEPMIMDEDVKFEGKIIDKNGEEVLAGGGEVPTFIQDIVETQEGVKTIYGGAKQVIVTAYTAEKSIFGTYGARTQYACSIEDGTLTEDRLNQDFNNFTSRLSSLVGEDTELIIELSQDGNVWNSLYVTTYVDTVSADTVKVIINAPNLGINNKEFRISKAYNKEYFAQDTKLDNYDYVRFTVPENANYTTIDSRFVKQADWGVRGIASYNEIKNRLGPGLLPETAELQDGDYRLKCTIADGVATYTWEAEE